jgi:GTP-binding protein EngB required for normal cell division
LCVHIQLRADIYLWDPDDLPRIKVVNKVSKESVKVHPVEANEQSNNCRGNEDAKVEEEPWLTRLGMDDHSAMSLMAGVLPATSFGGAWQYVADRVTDNLRDSEMVIHCYRSSKKVQVDPIGLDIICRPKKLIESKATHVVAGLIYGQESFCIFSRQQNPNSKIETTDDERMNNYANIFRKGLSDDQSLQELEEECKEEDDDGRPLFPPDLNCTLYTHIKGGTNRTLKPVAEQYEACRKMLHVMHEDRDVPLKVLLYPLHKLLPNEAGIIKLSENQTGKSRENEVGITHEVVILCQKMWNRLKCFRLEIDALTTELNKLKCYQWIPANIFKNAQVYSQCFSTFTSALNKEWHEMTLSIRRGDDKKETKMITMVEIAERKSPFVSKNVEDWLKYQNHQMKTFEMLAKLPGVCVLSSADQLERNIKSKGRNQFAVVLHLPSLKGQSDILIQKVIDYVEFSSKSHPPGFGIPWFQCETMLDSIAVNQRRIFSLSPVFSDWITCHNSDTTDVQYFVFYDERPVSGEGLPVIRLYECGSGEILSMNFSIPKTPGEVTVNKNRRGVIKLSWTAEETKDTSFLLQYRNVNKSDECWKSIQHSSNEITMDCLQSDESYLFRVATLTQGGKSPFGPISSEITIDPVYQRPTDLQCISVTDTSITIAWDNEIPEEEEDFDQFYDLNGFVREEENEKLFNMTGFLIDCWENGNRESTLIRRLTSDNLIKLEPLIADRLYCIHVKVAYTDSFHSKFFSSPSHPILQARTLRVAERAVHIVRRVSQKSPGSSSIDTYNLPLKKVNDAKTQGVGRYIFGEKSVLSFAGNHRKRTILMVGATGSGKSTLINALVNYMLGIEWNDDFRFKLIDEPDTKSQVHSQTELVTTYDLYEMKGSRLGYSLTVVDTPGFGDTQGLEQDNKIMRQIESYFKCKHGIQQLEAVCLVVRSSLSRLTSTEKYIFDSILSIFGQDIKDNIRLMVTFSDNAEPPVLEAIKIENIPCPIDPATGAILYHKLNNSVFFETNKSDRDRNRLNQTYFNIAVRGFKKFFNDLGQMETKSLTLTREVLEERKRLDLLVEGLRTKTEIKLTQVDELEKIKDALKENQDQMEANKDFEFEVEFLVPKATDISGTGQFTTNCQTCRTTCHFPCRQASDEKKQLCSVMDSSGTCMICKCPWNVHFNQKYRYEMVKEKVKRSSDAIRKQYQGAADETLTNEQLLENIKKEIDEHEKQLLELTKATYQHIRRLNEIALRPYLLSTSDYIDLLIKTENQNPRSCHQRISTLQKLRQKSEIKTKLIQEQQKSLIKSQ